MEKIKFKSKKYVKFNKKYYEISRNQLLIMDALLYDGSLKKYIDSNKKVRFSEHFGLLDFNFKKLEKIIISGDSSREDDDDIEILFPNNLNDIVDYEFMFHTHPPIKNRIKEGIIYEFPSINDIFHFINYFNKGLTQGSLIIAKEGIYVITVKSKIKKIKYNIKEEDKIMELLQNELFNIHSQSIKKYGKKFNDYFYNKNIISDRTFIDKFNKKIKKMFNNQIKIKYYNRVYEKKTKSWIIKSLFLRVSAIEPIK